MAMGRREARSRLERVQRAAHRRGAASPASTSASCPERAAGTSKRSSTAPRRARSIVVYLLGADEIDMDAARQGLRHLSGQPWRPRRPPRRCHPSRRRLYREGRDLRQHRRAPADDGPRRLPAGRRARRLEDHAGVVRARSARLCRSTPSPSSAPSCSPPRPHLALIDQVTPADSAAIEQAGGTRQRQDRQRSLRRGYHRFLSDQPDCTGVRDHGELERDA